MPNIFTVLTLHKQLVSESFHRSTTTCPVYSIRPGHWTGEDKTLLCMHTCMAHFGLM